MDVDGQLDLDGSWTQTLSNLRPVLDVFLTLGCTWAHLQSSQIFLRQALNSIVEARPKTWHPPKLMRRRYSLKAFKQNRQRTVLCDEVPGWWTVSVAVEFQGVEHAGFSDMTHRCSASGKACCAKDMLNAQKARLLLLGETCCWFWLWVDAFTEDTFYPASKHLPTYSSTSVEGPTTTQQLHTSCFCGRLLGFGLH